MSVSSAKILRDQFHRPLPPGLYPDPPDLGENSINLFTLPYIELIDALANVLFPPRQVSVGGRERTMRVRDARVDRYVMFRATWQPDFGVRIQLALRDLSEFCARCERSHFANLPLARQQAILEALEIDKLQGWSETGERSAKRCFEIVYDAITEGLFGEPGYGGNDRGLGWQYSNFMPPEEL
jgi:hypothetical protein